MRLFGGKIGFVGSGIHSLSSQILSKSFRNWFENRTLRGTPKKLSIPCKSLICKGFFFFLPSPSHPSASMAKPSDDSKYLVKKLCRDFDRTSERNRRFCAIGATKTRHPLVERHLWCCDWASFELRKASYRTSKDHLSTCDTCLTARGNVRRGASNEQP